MGEAQPWVISAELPGVYLHAVLPAALRCADLTLLYSLIPAFPFLWLLCAIVQPTETFLISGQLLFQVAQVELFWSRKVCTFPFRAVRCLPAPSPRMALTPNVHK